MKKIFLPFTVIIALFSCEQQTTDVFSIDFGYNYLPVEVGKFYEYRSDSIIYDPSETGTEILSSSTFVREEIVDTTTDNTGETWYIIERSERSDEAQQWQIRRVYRISRSEDQALRNEDNLDLVTMVFPLEEGKEWDATQFFDETLIVTVAGESIEQYKSWGAQLVRLGQSYTVEGMEFEDVAEVRYADNENLIERRFAQEVYARDIGLVYREMVILDTQCQVCCNADFAICEEIDWEEKAEKGYILRQYITDFN